MSKRPSIVATTLDGLSAGALGVVLGGAVAVLPAVAQAGDPASQGMLSPEANEIDVDEHLGESVDPKLEFVDQDGAKVTLGDFLDGERPVLLTMNYYRCPVLCNVQLNQLTEGLAQMDWVPGDKNFRVVTVSIDPREGPELAKEKRANHLEALGKGDDVDWQFLTGDALNVRLLAAQIGLGYAYDKEQDQYAHPPVVMFLSPDGKISRYVYGLTYRPQDIKFALIESAEGRVGSTVDKIILSCFHYDASAGRYGPFAFGIMRLGGSAMVLLVGTGLFFLWRRERRRAATTLEAVT